MPWFFLFHRSSLLFVSELYSSTLVQELLEPALGGGAVASGYWCFSWFTLKRQLAVVTPLIPFPHLNLIAHLKHAIITFLILSGDPRPHFMLFFYVNQLR